jgi:hypothetical protein
LPTLRGPDRVFIVHILPVCGETAHADSPDWIRSHIDLPLWL